MRETKYTIMTPMVVSVVSDRGVLLGMGGGVYLAVF